MSHTNLTDIIQDHRPEVLLVDGFVTINNNIQPRQHMHEMPRHEIKEIIPGSDVKIVTYDGLIYADLKKIMTREYLEDKGIWDYNGAKAHVIDGVSPAFIMFEGFLLQKCDAEDLLYVEYIIRHDPALATPKQEVIPIPIHFGPVCRLVFPPRALTSTDEALQPLFDLPEDVRVLASYVDPPRKNHPGAPSRTPWDPEHKTYLFELMTLAMLILNRGLLPKDFRAITDALHRRFMPDNKRIPYRGWNAIHTFGARGKEYDLLKNEVIP